MITNIKHIILADDDEEDVEMFQTALDETCPRNEVTVAADGDKLLNLLEKLPVPDAIVIDLNMPCKSGKQCLQVIRSQKQYDRTPVIILSTSKLEADMQYCLSKGATQYFVKPKNFIGFKTLARNICSGDFFAMN